MMNEKTNVRCKCLNPQCDAETFHETDIGVDRTNLRFGNVSLFDCRYCGSRWLHYAIGYEDWTQLNRWYRGLISIDQSREMTPEWGAEFLGNLSWYFYGGRDFDSNGEYGCGPLAVELEDALAR